VFFLKGKTGFGIEGAVCRVEGFLMRTVTAAVVSRFRWNPL
jgi:hypothetical protein